VNVQYFGGNHQHRAIEEELDTFGKRKIGVFDLLTGGTKKVLKKGRSSVEFFVQILCSASNRVKVLKKYQILFYGGKFSPRGKNILTQK
jgi:hypothetical protein